MFWLEEHKKMQVISNGFLLVIWGNAAVWIMAGKKAIVIYGDRREIWTGDLMVKSPWSYPLSHDNSYVCGWDRPWF